MLHYHWCCYASVDRRCHFARSLSAAGEDIKVLANEPVVDDTSAGAALVNAVTQHRRRDIARIVARMPPGSSAELVEALNAFAAAAGEPPNQSWWLGWAP